MGWQKIKHRQLPANRGRSNVPGDKNRHFFFKRNGKNSLKHPHIQAVIAAHGEAKREQFKYSRLLMRKALDFIFEGPILVDRLRY